MKTIIGIRGKQFSKKELTITSETKVAMKKSSGLADWNGFQKFIAKILEEYYKKLILFSILNFDFIITTARGCLYYIWLKIKITCVEGYTFRFDCMLLSCDVHVSQWIYTL